MNSSIIILNAKLKKELFFISFIKGENFLSTKRVIENMIVMITKLNGPKLANGLKKSASLPPKNKKRLHIAMASVNVGALTNIREKVKNPRVKKELSGEYINDGIFFDCFFLHFLVSIS